MDEETPNQEPLVRLGIDTPAPEEARIAPPPRGGSGARVPATREELVPAESGLTPRADEEIWGTGKKAVRTPPWGWLALLGLILAGSLVWAILTAGKGDREAFESRTEPTVAMISDRQETGEATRLIGRIENTVRQFLAAESVAELQDVVRHPERVLPLMRHHYQSAPPVPTVMTGFRVLQPRTLDLNRTFWIASMDVEGASPRNLLLEVIGPEEVRVDWETAVTYQPMDWDDFARDRPAGRSLEFRVQATPDSLHSHEFGDSGKWECYRLTAPGAGETLFGYAATGSAAAKKLSSVFAPGQKESESVILRLLVPEGLRSPSGVVIEALASPRWTYVESPE